MSKQTPDIFFTYAHNPIAQAGVSLAGALGMMLLGKIVHDTGLMGVNERFAWMSIGALMLFFAMFNSVFSLWAKNSGTYWGRSIYSFMGLAALGGLAAWGVSGLSINEAGSFRWIYIVLTFGYLVFISIMNMVKNIVHFAQREEWTHPRLRRRKGRKD